MRTIITFLLFLFLYSCQKNIEIDLPAPDVVPVVNCLFPDDVPLTVNISLSINPQDTITSVVENATVTIFRENEQVTILKYTGKGNYSNSGFIPVKGLNYRLIVEIPGFKSIKATGYIPDNKTSLQSIRSESGYRQEPVLGTGEEPIIPVENIYLSFYDNPSVKDYYGISTVQNKIIYHHENNKINYIEVKNEFTSGWYFGSDDIKVITEGLQNYENSIQLFSDNAFTNQPEIVGFYVNKEVKSKYWVRFYQFSPDAFQYLKSWIFHANAQVYDFWEIAEPIPLFSNIENGYGIFAGYSSTLYEINPGTTLNLN